MLAPRCELFWSGKSRLFQLLNWHSDKLFPPDVLLPDNTVCYTRRGTAYTSRYLQKKGARWIGYVHT